MVRQDTNSEVTFDVTPMIDIVFLLIIFFLVSSHLARQEARLQLELPEAGSGDLITADGKRQIYVNLRGDQRRGTILVHGRVVTATELERRLSKIRASETRPLQIVLRGEQGLPYRFVSPALKAAQRAKISDVSIATFKGAAK